jgi:hypothetical protein
MGLSGCNGSTSPSPSPTSQLSNVSGDYTGTLTDAQGGSGAATATFAQHGSSVGGAVTATQSGGAITAQVSMALTAANALSGAMVVDFADGTSCTYSVNGNYANNGSTSAVMSGSYTAVTGCSGDTGSFSLTQQCTDTITSVDRRAMSYPPHC